MANNQSVQFFWCLTCFIWDFDYVIIWLHHMWLCKSLWLCAATATKSLQSCPTLCDPIDGSPSPSLGFSRQEHWSGLPFPSPMHESEKWKWSRSVVSDSATSWTAAYQAPPSMGFSRQEYWSGVPSPVPLPFLNPVWTSGSSRFMYCWSLAWRILSITLLVCEMSAIVW